jgi:hypothetical protein
MYVLFCTGGAHELFSGFWISIGDTKEAGYHIVKAVELYEEWGGGGQ